MYVMAGFPRILKSPCASKEIRFPKLNLPTVYQRKWRAKLADENNSPEGILLSSGVIIMLTYFRQLK